MDFAITDEQRLVQQETRALLARHAPPEAARAWQQRGGICPPELWRVIVDAGWPGYGIPASHGGLGADLVDLVLLFEECGRAAVPSLFRETVAATLALVDGGYEAALPALVRGTRQAALAVAEAGAVHDVARLVTRLEGGRLHGEKRFVVTGAEAELLLVAARTPRGLVVAVVPRLAPGVTVEPLPIWAGESIACVRFDAAPVEAVIAEGEPADRLLERALARRRLFLAAELLGGLARTLELTVEYTKGRVQFGRPIGTFQAVQHQCADVAIALEGARALVHQAAWRSATGTPVLRDIAIACAWTASRFTAATLTAHQLHGGMGFVTEYPLHLYSNRAKAGEAILAVRPVLGWAT